MAVEKLELGFGVGAAPDYEGSQDYVLAVGSYSRLIEDAADSPIVDDESDFNRSLLWLMLTYDF
ncbi:MAG: MipA/OmpV family protein [Deltaproteobacteria bacterium]|nr:MAG: MipA/OmpV family protein [Deltaproteobacteria bacterium]